MLTTTYAAPFPIFPSPLPMHGPPSPILTTIHAGPFPSPSSTLPSPLPLSCKFPLPLPLPPFPVKFILLSKNKHCTLGIQYVFSIKKKEPGVEVGGGGGG